MRTKTAAQADKILTAAAQLFANHRFHEARMDDIARLAEVGKGTLYRYFEDKEQLYTALLDRAGAALETRLEADLADVTGARAQLVVMVRSVIAYFDDNPHLFDLIQHAEVMQRPGQPFPWQKVRDHFAARVRGIFEEGRRAGEFHIEPVELALLTFLGGMRSVTRFGPRPRPEGLAEQMVQGLLAGYARAGCSNSKR